MNAGLLNLCFDTINNKLHLSCWKTKIKEVKIVIELTHHKIHFLI